MVDTASASDVSAYSSYSAVLRMSAVNSLPCHKVIKLKRLEYKLNKTLLLILETLIISFILKFHWVRPCQCCDGVVREPFFKIVESAVYQHLALARKCYLRMLPELSKEPPPNK